MAVLIEMMPKRRTTSGLLEISDGRRISLSRKKSISSYIPCRQSLVTVSEQALPNFTRPSRIKPITEFWITSVYISKAGIVWSRPNAPKTALAMLPTPDCNGRNVEGMIPRFISAARKSATFWPILSVIGSAAANERASSGQFVSTIPTIFFGSTCM